MPGTCRRSSADRRPRSSTAPERRYPVPHEGDSGRGRGRDGARGAGPRHCRNAEERAAGGGAPRALGALPPATAATPKSCPPAWAHGWQQLANRIQAPVYCPTWMPNRLDAKIGGQFIDIFSVTKDHSYLVSFLEHGDLGSGDVHVNFRGYPSRAAIPKC